MTETKEVAQGEEKAQAEKYKTMIVGVGKSHADEHEKLVALAEKYGCKPGVLVWHAIDKLLANPPKPEELPARSSGGASVATSRAAGFWVQFALNGQGMPEAINVVEVATKTDVEETEGSQFYLYRQISQKDSQDIDEEKTEKNRQRALGQAKRAAAFNAKIARVPFDEKKNVKILKK